MKTFEYKQKVSGIVTSVVFWFKVSWKTSSSNFNTFIVPTNVNTGVFLHHTNIIVLTLQPSEHTINKSNLFTKYHERQIEEWNGKYSWSCLTVTPTCVHCEHLNKHLYVKKECLCLLISLLPLLRFHRKSYLKMFWLLQLLFFSQ